MRKPKFLQDARQTYPELPTDKVMGAIFLNLGVRLALAVGLLMVARWIMFMPGVSLVAQVVWSIVILGALVHTGYFLYTFHLYLQDNMRKTIERRKQALKDQEKSARVKKAKKDDGHP